MACSHFRYCLTVSSDFCTSNLTLQNPTLCPNFYYKGKPGVGKRRHQPLPSRPSNTLFLPIHTCPRAELSESREDHTGHPQQSAQKEQLMNTCQCVHLNLKQIAPSLAPSLSKGYGRRDTFQQNDTLFSRIIIKQGVLAVPNEICNSALPSARHQPNLGDLAVLVPFYQEVRSIKTCP